MALRISFVVFLAITLVAIPFAFALYPQLSTTLSGPPINGKVPKGDAKIDQSKLPSQPGKLETKVKHVSLPDGTLLTVVITDCGLAPVGQLTLSQREGHLFITLPLGCFVGGSSAISLKNGSQAILSGGAPWKV